MSHFTIGDKDEMADKFPRTVIYNDGEGLEEIDLNVSNQILSTYIDDGVLGSYVFDEVGGGMPTGRGIAAIGHGGAVYVDEGTDLTVKFNPGLIGQSSGNPVDGVSSSNLWHYMEDADVPDKTRSASTTNPRWDALYVSIASVMEAPVTRDFKDDSTDELTSITLPKIAKTDATYTWVTGAENASPVVPAGPAGAELLCAVRVEVASAPFDPLGPTTATSQVRDYRVPAGFSVRYQASTEEPIFIALSGFGGTANVLSGFATRARNVDTEGANPVSIFYPTPIRGAHQRLASFRNIVSGVDNPASHTFQAVSPLLASSIASPWEISMSVDGANNETTFEVPLWMNGYAAGFAAAKHSGYRIPGRDLLVIQHLIQGPEVFTETGMAWSFWG